MSGRALAVDNYTEGPDPESSGGGGNAGNGISVALLATTAAPPSQMVGEAVAAGLTAAAVTCQKRGRAQKKRARKIKETMRQFCREVAAAAVAGRAVTRLAGTESTPSGSSGATTAGSGLSNEAPAVTPWPRLERAARDLSALAWARLQQRKDVSVDSGGDSLRARPVVSSSSVTPPTAPSTENNDAGTVSVVGVEVVANLGVEDSKKIEATGGTDLPSGKAPYEGCAAGQDKGIPRGVKCTGSAAHGEPGQLLIVQSPTFAEIGEGSTINNAESSTVLGTAAAATAEAAGASKGNHEALADSHVANVEDSVALPTDGKVAAGDGDPGQANQQRESTAAPPSHRKTRRGKRAGGAINRRRGAKERAACCARYSAENATVTATRATGTSLAEEGTGEEGEAGERGERLLTERESAVVPISRGVAPEAAPAEEAMARQLLHGEAGPVSWRGGCGGGNTCREGGGGSGFSSWCNVGSVSVRVGEDVVPSSSKCSSLDLAVLEAAALRSIRELCGMFSSSVSSSSSRTEKAVVGGRGCSSAVSGSGSAAALSAPTPCGGGSSRLQSQARKTHGLLESLVMLCAPFPWTPASLAPAPVRSCCCRPVHDPSLPTLASSSVDDNGQSPVPALSTAACKGNGGGSNTPVAQCRATGSSDSSFTVGRPPAAGDEKGDIGPARTRGRCGGYEARSRSSGGEARGVSAACANVGGLGVASAREALTESALVVLLTALGEADNREHVLRIDAGAPLVRREGSVRLVLRIGAMVVWFFGFWFLLHL